MNKISSAHENPIDRVLLDISGSALPLFHRTGHVPNVLTTYSFAAGLGAVACLWHHRPTAFAVLMSISYFFDVMDGQFARQYNQTSTFGDWYDHITDILVLVLILHVIVVKRGKRLLTWPFAVVAVVALLLLATHVGCQQQWKNPSLGWETLDVFRWMCPEREWIRWTRFFGPGTLNVGLILMTWYIFQEKNAHDKDK